MGFHLQGTLKLLNYVLYIYIYIIYTYIHIYNIYNIYSIYIHIYIYIYIYTHTQTDLRGGGDGGAPPSFCGHFEELRTMLFEAELIINNALIMHL